MTLITKTGGRLGLGIHQWIEAGREKVSIVTIEPTPGKMLMTTETIKTHIGIETNLGTTTTTKVNIETNQVKNLITTTQTTEVGI